MLNGLQLVVLYVNTFSGSKGFFYNVFCSGGINKEDPFNPKDNKDNGMMVFFRDVIGNWLNKPYAKALVLTIFVIYLGFASWGVTNLQEGLEKKRLSRFDSYSVDYYEVEDEFFREYPFRINVSISVKHPAGASCHAPIFDKKGMMTSHEACIAFCKIP